MDGAMFKGLGTMLLVGFIAVVIVIIMGGYGLYRVIFPKEKKIESKELIVPEIKLVTDGKTIDTVYIYKEKK